MRCVICGLNVRFDVAGGGLCLMRVVRLMAGRASVMVGTVFNDGFCDSFGGGCWNRKRAYILTNGDVIGRDNERGGMAGMVEMIRVHAGRGTRKLENGLTLETARRRKR